MRVNDCGKVVLICLNRIWKFLISLMTNLITRVRKSTTKSNTLSINALIEPALTSLRQANNRVQDRCNVASTRWLTQEMEIRHEFMHQTPKQIRPNLQLLRDSQCLAYHEIPVLTPRQPRQPVSPALYKLHNHWHHH